MLVKVCDLCGERVDVDNYINIEGGFIRSAEEYNNIMKRDFYEFDICMSCARTFNLAHVIVSIKKSNE